MDALEPPLAVVLTVLRVRLDSTEPGALEPLLAAVLAVLYVLPEAMQQLSALRLQMLYASHVELADIPMLRTQLHVNIVLQGSSHPEWDL